MSRNPTQKEIDNGFRVLFLGNTISFPDLNFLILSYNNEELIYDRLLLLENIFERIVTCINAHRFNRWDFDPWDHNFDKQETVQISGSDENLEKWLKTTPPSVMRGLLSAIVNGYLSNCLCISQDYVIVFRSMKTFEEVSDALDQAVIEGILQIEENIITRRLGWLGAELVWDAHGEALNRVQEFA